MNVETPKQSRSAAVVVVGLVAALAILIGLFVWLSGTPADGPDTTGDARGPHRPRSFDDTTAGPHRPTDPTGREDGPSAELPPTDGPTPESTEPPTDTTPTVTPLPTPPIEPAVAVETVSTVLVGRVIDSQTGQPLQRAVSLTLRWVTPPPTSPTPDGAPLPLLSRTIRPGETGEFRVGLQLPNVPGNVEALAEITLQAAHAEAGNRVDEAGNDSATTPSLQTKLAVALVRNDATHVGTILLWADLGSGTVRGTVRKHGETGETGAAGLAGARVALIDHDARDGYGVPPMTSVAFTDAAGTFEFTGVRTGRYVVTATASGFGTETSAPRPVVAEQTAVVDLALRGALPLTGRVTEAEAGAPVEDVTVAALLMRDPPLPIASTQTDADGRYAFDQLAAGAYYVVAEKPGFTTAFHMVTISGPTVQDFELSAGFGLRIRVMDDEGNAVRNYLVRAWREATQQEDFGAEAIRQQTARTHSVASSDGRFEIRGLEVGPHTVEVIDFVHARTVKRNIPVGDAPNPNAGGANEGDASPPSDTPAGEVLIVVPTGGVLVGKVLTTGETPREVGGARIAVARSLAFPRMELPFAESNELVTYSGHDGAFRLTGLAEGMVYVWVSHPDYPTLKTSVRMQPGAEPLEQNLFLVGSPAKLFGRAFTVQGDPAEGCFVIAQMGMLERHNAMVDATGSFSFDRLIPGSYAVMLYDQKTGNVIASQTVRLAEGDVREITLGAPTPDSVVVEGQLTIGGDGANNAAISFAPTAGGDSDFTVTTTNPQGEFQARLRPGKYVVLVQRGAPAPTFQFRLEVTVPAVAKHRFDWTVPEVELVGRLVDASTNQPMPAGVELVLEPAREAAEEVSSLSDLLNRYAGQISTKNADGTFSWQGIAAGRYHLRGYAEGFGLLLVENVEIPDFGVVDVGDQFFVKQSSLNLFVGTDAGQPINNALLSIADAAGRNLTVIDSFRTGDDGRVDVHYLRPQTTYAITATAPGYAPATIQLSTGSTLNHQLAMTLPLGGALLVLVETPGGEPVADATVVLKNPAGQIVRPPFSQHEIYANLHQTDAGGRVLRASLAAGNYTVTATHAGKTVTAIVHVPATGPAAEPTLLRLTLPD